MPSTLPVSGDIDSKNFPFLVTDLHRHGATGSLKVDGPSYQKDLYFRGGRILFGSSNDPRDQLGAILIDAGRLTPEQLEEVNSKVGPGNPLAKVLSDSGLVTQQELTDAARLKVEQILGDVLGYKEGSFEFEDGVLPKGAVDLKLHTDRLVLAAVRRIADRAFVLGHLESLEVVLTPAVEASADLKAVAGELLAEIDGQRTLKESIARTKLEEFDAAKVACALLFLGIVTRPGLPSVASPAQRGDDSPFFVSEPASSSSDLGAVARQAMGEPAPPPAAEPAAAPVALTFDEPAPMAPHQPSAPFTPPPLPPLVSAQPPTPLAPSVAPLPSVPTIDPGDAPEERPLFPRIEPPSPSDLAAINALLHSPIPDPSTRSAPAVRRPAPRFAPPTQARRAPESGGSGQTVLRVALVLVLVLAAGAAGWWYWLGPGALSGARPAAAGRTATPTATLAPPTLATPGAVASPVATAETAATPSAATAATPSVPPPANPVPSATAAPAPPPTGTGRSLLRERRYADAGRAFAAEARALRGRHTVQILVACSDETLDKTLQSVGSEEWFIIPVLFKGRSCHRLCWGMYETPAAADKAQHDLPGYFRSGGALPRVVPLATILP
jgi:hypothetical protein